MFSLESFRNAFREKNIQIDAVMVVQDDRVLALERYSDEMDHNVYSVAKSFASAAVGMLIEEGKMDLDHKVVDYFVDILPENIDPRWKNVTLRHMFTMSEGHDKAYMMSAERKILRGETDRKVEPEIMNEWLLHAFTRPLVYEAGERFCYNNLAPYVVGRMVEKVTGMTLSDYLYEKLWKPLQCRKPRWETDLSGHTIAPTGLYLDIVDMVKFGQIYLGKGEFQGHRYLSEKWVEESTSNLLPSQVINPTGLAHDEKQGYGYYFWQNHGDGYRAYGREGQFIVVLPEKKAVIATQANHPDSQEVFDLIKEYIYPEL